MNDKVVIVTAASQGIGAGCAKELAAQGYRVSLLARSASVLDLAQSLRGIGLRGSLTSTADLETLVQNTLEKWGRIDGVVMRFGDQPRPDLLEISDQLWLDNFELLFLSVVRLTRLVTGPMRQNGLFLALPSKLMRSGLWRYETVFLQLL